MMFGQLSTRSAYLTSANNREADRGKVCSFIQRTLTFNVYLHSINLCADHVLSVSLVNLGYVHAGNNKSLYNPLNRLGTLIRCNMMKNETVHSLCIRIRSNWAVWCWICKLNRRLCSSNWLRSANWPERRSNSVLRVVSFSRARCSSDRICSVSAVTADCWSVENTT